MLSFLVSAPGWLMQRILEIGCGWGSLSFGWQLISKQWDRRSGNSNSQREYIKSQAVKRQLTNIEVLTCDINDFEPAGCFDRVVSVEMFEHVRNHRALLGLIADWLNPSGKLFVHIFTHKEHSYLFEANSAKDWMSQYFFTGGIMPSADYTDRSRDIGRRGSLEGEW